MNAPVWLWPLVLLLVSLVLGWRLFRVQPARRVPRAQVAQPRGFQAAQVAQLAAELEVAGAQWPEIAQRLNPGADPKAAAYLAELRGPHLFSPGTALGVIQAAAQAALARNPQATAQEALRQAVADMHRVTKAGD